MSRTTAADDITRDFESYLRGEEPGPTESLRAPKIDEWTVFIDIGHGTMKICGSVSGHPTLADGDTMGATPVVWLDRHWRWFRDKHRIYTLGRPNGGEIRIEGGKLL